MQGGFALLLCAVAVTLCGVALSPQVGWSLNSHCSSECDAWCNTVLWARASGNRAPKGRSLLLAELGLKKYQRKQWPKQGKKEKLLFISLPGDDVVLHVWVALQERVMSGAWRSRHSSCLCQGTTHPVVLGPILSAPLISLCLLRDILPTWECFVRLNSMMPVRCPDTMMTEGIKRIQLKFIKICVAQGSSRECTGKSPCHTSLSLVWIAFRGVCCCGTTVCVYIYLYIFICVYICYFNKVEKEIM